MEVFPLFMFIDEGGNFDFSRTGTKFYSLTGLMTPNPSLLNEDLNDKRFSILSKLELGGLGDVYLEEKLSRKYHASEDKQIVRDEVFKIIQKVDRGKIRAISVVAQKNKANPSVRDEVSFYGKLVMPLLKFALKGYIFSHLVIFLDNSPINKRKSALLKNIKKTLSSEFPNSTYSVYCVPSESNYMLQITDYINWAIFRKWEGDDKRSYVLIKSYLEKEELNIFERGTTEYY